MLCKMPSSSSLRTRLMIAALGRVDHLPVVSHSNLPCSSITAYLLSELSLSHCTGVLLSVCADVAKERRISSSSQCTGTDGPLGRLHKCIATPMHNRTKSYRRSGLWLRAPVNQPGGGEGGCQYRMARFLDFRWSGDSNEMAESVGEGEESSMGGGRARRVRDEAVDAPPLRKWAGGNGLSGVLNESGAILKVQL
jgi:hypothetical protein